MFHSPRKPCKQRIFWIGMGECWDLYEFYKPGKKSTSMETRNKVKKERNVSNIWFESQEDNLAIIILESGSGSLHILVFQAISSQISDKSSSALPI